MSRPLEAPYALEYVYKRSLGPVMSRFFTALSGGTILGGKTAAGRVIAPPSEYDPETGDAIGELIPVGPAGTVVSWTWVAVPRRLHPLARPFAFALVKLDGADTAMLHAIDAGAEAVMRSGMRVTARFAAKPAGGIRDLEYFVPIDLEIKS